MIQPKDVNMTPKYHQLRELLQDAIASGRYPAGSRLPSERELVAQYGVSRITVTRAMMELSRLGLVRQVQGKGTFVADTAGVRTVVVSPPVSYRIPFIMTDVISPFYAAVLRGILEVLQRRDYSVETYNTDEQYARETALLQRLAGEPIAGILFVPTFCDRPYRPLVRLRQAEVPVVQLDRYISGFPADYVCTDNIAAGRAAGAAFVRRGHRSVAWLGRYDRVSSVRERFQGFRDTMQARGVPVDERLVVDFEPRWHGRDEEFGDMAVQKLLGQDVRFTGVIALSSGCARAAVRRLRESGVRVPEQVSLLVFDDSTQSTHGEIPLTAIRQDVHGMGVAAARLLLRRIAERAKGAVRGNPETIRLPYALVDRGSVRRPR